MFPEADSEVLYVYQTRSANYVLLSFKETLGKNRHEMKHFSTRIYFTGTSTAEKRKSILKKDSPRLQLQLQDTGRALVRTLVT